ncbi:DUF3810 domain-containing protein [Aquimarina agarilytica]|uniref:DUF3810 domain-containing protein n=1 Tax=Aquimarina agarilytica TaxID=1087449 RepID=UPI00028922F9|nr:DUF3810 domain-containing protein [Aquimarina agarilytica]
MQIKKWIIPILLPIQIIGVKWISQHPEWIENNYSLGFYPKISKLLRSIFGYFDSSIGDIIYILLIISILAFLWKKVFKRRVSWQKVLVKTISLASIVYFLFHFLWGLNYYRLPLHKVLDIAHKYSTNDLEKVTYQLIEKSNMAHKKLEQNDSLAVIIPYATEEIFEHTTEAYLGLQQIFPKLEYTPKSIKKSFLSVPLAYMGFSGYLNPFTNEAQVNRLIVPYKMPTTSCHEEAHQLGFAKENEANFIGAMACMHSPDPYFQYSGYTFALRYCLHELYRSDEQKFNCALEKIRPGIRKNYQQTRDFWKQYKNPTEPLFKAFYNQFLKVNNQSGGIKSYNYVVALLVNYMK